MSLYERVLARHRIINTEDPTTISKVEGAKRVYKSIWGLGECYPVMYWAKGCAVFTNDLAKGFDVNPNTTVDDPPSAYPGWYAFNKGARIAMEVMETGGVLLAESCPPSIAQRIALCLSYCDGLSDEYLRRGRPKALLAHESKTEDLQEKDQC